MCKRKLVGVLVMLLMVVVVGVEIGVLGQENEVVFRFAIPWGNMTWDPAVHSDSPTSICVFNTYDPLMMPVKGEAPIPWVAESYTGSEDGLTYTFKIRDGIKFHDGTELTAEDVAFSMDRMLTLKTGFAFLWEGILEPGDTEVVDEYTVTFHLVKAFGPFITTLVQFNILSKDLCMSEKKPGDYGEFGDYAQGYLTTHDAGSGPYKLESVELGAKYSLTRFEDYWKGWKENQIDKITMEIIAEDATRLMMFKKGELDMTDDVLAFTPATAEELAAIEGATLQEDPQIRLAAIQMNNTKPPLDDINVRKAISYAFDYDAILEDVFGGGELAQGPVPNLMPGHAEDVIQYRQDLEKAEFFLNRSRYSKDQLAQMELEFTYISGYEVERLWGLVLINSLEPLGLKVKLRAEPWARIVAMSTSPETTTHFMATFCGAKYGSADVHTYNMYHPAAWGTYMSCSWYENPEASELMEKARTTIDTEERYDLYRQAQRIIVGDAASIFLVNPPHRITYWNYVKGYTYIGLLEFDLKFYNLWIEK